MGRFNAIPLVAGALLASFAGVALMIRGRSKKKLIILKNESGMQVHISQVGCAIVKLIVPDKQGNHADVVLGFDSPDQYLNCSPCPYFGVIVGRVANRIAKGKFSLDGKEYTLEVNNGPNALHGGARGLHKRVFTSREISDESSLGVELSYTSPDGEEGYPGTVSIQVVYRMSRRKNELETTVTATSDKRTILNIAGHSYFNLAGHQSGSILDHVLTIKGDQYTPVDEVQIPTGEILPVQGTPFDFTAPHTIGQRISEVDGGYDHNYVLFGMGPQAKFITKNGMASDRPKLAATLFEPTSGRIMDLLTTAPGVQFYSGNFLSHEIGGGKEGTKYSKHGGLCLETQGFPNAVNADNFPSVVLEPGQKYRHVFVYSFRNV